MFKDKPVKRALEAPGACFSEIEYEDGTFMRLYPSFDEFGVARMVSAFYDEDGELIASF